MGAALDKSATALVFIEFQREWLDEDGRLFVHLVEDKAAFRASERNARDVLLTARSRGWPVVHAGLDLRDDPTYQVFAHGSRVTGLRATIPAAGTWIDSGAEFAEPFTPQPGEFTVRGRTGASILKNSNLDAYLRNNRIDTLVLLGYATHVCVESTLREAHDTGLNAVVVTDGCAAFTAAQHQHVIRHVLHHFGEAVSTEALIAILEA